MSHGISSVAAVQTETWFTGFQSQEVPRNIFPRATALERLPFVVGDDLVAVASEVIEQRRDRDEPAVLPAEPRHQLLESGVQRRRLDRAMAECVYDDARAAFGLETILIRFRDRRGESCDVRSSDERVPRVDERPQRIVIRHGRARGERVDVRVHEVAAVLDSLAADIAPERGCPSTWPKWTPFLRPSVAAV